MATINKVGHFNLNSLNYRLADRQVLNRSELGVLEQAITIGETSYKTDPRVSSWVMSDFTGGIGVEDITGADTTRYRWGTADARYPGAITLGPLVTQTRPSAATDSWRAYPVGDVPGTNEEFYVAWDEGGGVVGLYAWNETSDTWRARSADATAIPYRVGNHPVYTGSSANRRLFLTRAATTAQALRTTGAGTLNVDNLTTLAESFVIWDNRLWSFRSDFELEYSFDGTTWTAIQNPLTGADLLLDKPAGFLARLIPWYNLAGESTLYVYAAGSLWAFNSLKGGWELIYQAPSSDDDSSGTAAIWRPTEDLWLSLGGGIVKRTPAGVSVLLSGPGADAEGVPDGFIGFVRDLCAEFQGLYALVTPGAASFIGSQLGHLAHYTGVGWHIPWVNTSSIASTMCVVSKASGAYRLWWGAGSYVYTMELDRGIFSPRQAYSGSSATGLRSFAASSYLETGRFWAQTMGLSKVALALEVFMENADADETLTVQYQTDTVTAWTTLGTAIVTGRNNGTYMTRIRFGTVNSAGVYPGIVFNWIKFKFTFARGSTVTNTPIMNAAVLHFIKARDNTPGFQLVVDTTQTLDGRTPDTQRGELRAMLEGTASGGPIYSLKYADHVLGVIVTGMASEEASGSDERGLVTLSLLAVQVVS